MVEANRRALPAFLAAFAFPSFRRLWTGAFLSSIGNWTQDVALAWVIHTRFGDPLYLGLRTFASDAPLITFMLLGGAVADRVDRRRILLTSQLLQMSSRPGPRRAVRTGRLGIEPILLFAFLTGLAQSQSAPTYQAVLTSVVPPRSHPERGRAQLAAVQPLARDRARDRGCAAGAGRDRRLLRGERAVVPGRDLRDLADRDPRRTPRPRRRAWPEAWARGCGT